MPASLAASARLIPSRALAIASIRKAARRFASCRACRRSASGVSSFRIGSAAPIIPSLAGRRSCPPGEHASRTPKSQFIRAAVLEAILVRLQGVRVEELPARISEMLERQRSLEARLAATSTQGQGQEELLDQAKAAVGKAQYEKADQILAELD